VATNRCLPLPLLTYLHVCIEAWNARLYPRFVKNIGLLFRSSYTQTIGGMSQVVHIMYLVFFVSVAYSICAAFWRNKWIIIIRRRSLQMRHKLKHCWVVIAKVWPFVLRHRCRFPYWSLSQVILHFDFYSGRVLFLSVNVLSCIFSRPQCHLNSSRHFSITSLPMMYLDLSAL